MPTLTRFTSKGGQLWQMGLSGYIYIEESVLNVINSYRQTTNGIPESGGFLAGYYKGKDLHITHVTTPLSGDYCSRFRFERRDPGHVEQMKEWYKQSGGRLNCLGEWHTHPEMKPAPSQIDVNSWHVFNKNRRGQQAIFVIAGTEGTWVGAVLY